MTDFKNFLPDKQTGNPNANQPRLSVEGREGIKDRQHVRHEAYKNNYYAVRSMYPELTETPAVPAASANIAAAAVQAAKNVPFASEVPAPQTYPLPEHSVAPKNTGDTFMAPTETTPTDWVEQLARKAEEALRQNTGANND
jgi:hypothetical protein